jgi:hypothetical protein
LSHPRSFVSGLELLIHDISRLLLLALFKAR